MFAGFLVEREKNLVEGSKEERSVEIAANLKGKLSDSEISEVTGLTIEKVKNL